MYPIYVELDEPYDPISHKGWYICSGLNNEGDEDFLSTREMPSLYFARESDCLMAIKHIIELGYNNETIYDIPDKELRRVCYECLKW